MRWSTVSIIATLFLVGCVNMGKRPLGTISGRMDAQPEPGEWCRVTLPEQHDNTFSSRQITLTGRVENIDGEEITLTDVVMEGQTQKSTPVLSRVPYVRRLFTSTAFGVESVSSRTLTPAEFERLDIITKEEARRSASHLLAREMVAAVIPGPL